MVLGSFQTVLCHISYNKAAEKYNSYPQALTYRERFDQAFWRLNWMHQ